MSDKTIGFIGGGNMAGALIGGLIRSHHDPAAIVISEPDGDRRSSLKAEYGVTVLSDNETVAEQADAVVLAVKPQVMHTVSMGIAPVLADHPRLVMSIAAGVRIASLKQWLGEMARIVRIMPNTPALVGSGVSALYADAMVDDSDRDFAESIIRSVGAVTWLTEETQMDIVTGLSGSGPRLFFPDDGGS